MSMYNIDMLEWLEINEDYLNSAFNKMEMLFSDLDMREKSDDVITELRDELKANGAKVFDWYYPTKSFIKIMFDIAERKIKEKYPNAIIKCTIGFNGNDSDIDVDKETFELAEKLIKERYE